MRPASRVARTEALLAAGVVIAGVIALVNSWQRWFDPVIDVGRELYVPQQLLHGARLYTDIRYYYPPLAPYLMAALTAITGPSLLAYAVIGIAQSAVIAALLWVAGRRIGGMWSGAGAALLFVAANMCGASTFGANFIFPYSEPATLGMLFLVAFFTAAIYERPWLAVVLAAASAWCKLDYAFAVAIGLAALVAIGRLRWKEVATFAAIMVVTAIGALSIFGAAPFVANVFPASLFRGAAARQFYALVGGGADWKTIVVEALIGLAAVATIEVLLRRDRRLAIAAAAIAGIVVPLPAFFRAAGVLQWATLGMRRRDPWLFAAGALSIASTIRIAFNVTPEWYGFVLIVPLYLVIARFIRGEVIWAALLLVVSLRSISEEKPRFALRQFAVDTPQGRFYDHNPDRAEVIREVLPLLSGRTLAVFPEGLALDYFAGVKTTLTYHTFTPAESADPKVESDVMREMTMHPPNHVILLQRDMSEFGSRGFGIDYDQRLLALIRSQYQVERAWTRPRFHLVLLTKEKQRAMSIESRLTGVVEQ